MSIHKALVTSMLRPSSSVHVGGHLVKFQHMDGGSFLGTSALWNKAKEQFNTHVKPALLDAANVAGTSLKNSVRNAVANAVDQKKTSLLY